MSRDPNSRRGDDVREAPHAALEIAAIVQLTAQDSAAAEIVLLPLDKAESRMRSGQVEALRGIKPFSAITLDDDMLVGLRVRVRGVRLDGEDYIVTDDAPAPASRLGRPSEEPADPGVSTDGEALADSVSDWLGGE